MLSNLEFPCWIWRRTCRPARVIGRLGSPHATSTLPQEELKLDEDSPFLPSLLSVSPSFPHSVISRTWAGEEGWSRSRSVGQVDVFPRCEKEGTRKETARKRGGERASFVFLSSLHSKQFNRHRAAKCCVAAVSRRLGWIQSLKNEIDVKELLNRQRCTYWSRTAVDIVTRGVRICTA